MNTEQQNIGGKGEGLLMLSRIDGLNVPPFALIPGTAGDKASAGIIDAFMTAHKTLRHDAPFSLAVRSSAMMEDRANASFAGAFTTHLHVPANTNDVLNALHDIRRHAEEKLSALFNTSAKDSIGVVVQEMIENPDYSGVCLSQGYGEEDCAYMLVNFRKGLGEDLVGGIDTGETLKVLRDVPLRSETRDQHPFLPQLIDALKKIESQNGGAPVDTEFAFKNGKLYMLQARPLVTDNPVTPEERKSAAKIVRQMQGNLSKLKDINDDILCSMSDINPRELLGENPHPINVSIFETIFSDSVITFSRATMGYNNTPYQRKITAKGTEILGRPYVSLLTSATSLMPRDINLELQKKLYDIYAKELIENPGKQDRVEFDLYLTRKDQVADFCDKHGIDVKDKDILHASFCRLEKDLEQRISFYEDTGKMPLDLNLPQYASFTIPAYEAKEKNLMSVSAAHFGGITRPDAVTEDLKQLSVGTTFFTIFARLAFYQKAKCDRLYGSDETARFLTDLDIPTARLERDLLDASIAKRTGGEEAFKTAAEALRAEYGHLRPGQFDIYAKPYREDMRALLDIDRYERMSDAEINAETTRLAAREERIRNLFVHEESEKAQNMRRLRLLMEARENVKHSFMRVYDHLATEIFKQAENLGIDREMLKSRDVRYIEKDNNENKQSSAGIVLPHVISAKTDLACVPMTTPGSYFGKEIVCALPLAVTEENLHSLTREKVEGRILVMDRADPGYDFLLLYKPAGILTKVGGPASHIAIRVNEMRIPACIGCGIDPSSVDEDKAYMLDCQNKKHGVMKKQKLQPAIKNNASPAS